MRTALILILLSAAPVRGADLALGGATVYPAPGARPIRDAVILIHDGRIAVVGGRASVRFPPGVQVLDCAGKFIVSGFWNSRLRIFTSGLFHACGQALGWTTRQQAPQKGRGAGIHAETELRSILFSSETENMSLGIHNLLETNASPTQYNLS